MGTHHQGPKPEIDALDAYIKLMRAAETVTTLAQSVLPKKMTFAQFCILEALFHCGPMCQSNLAVKLLRTGANVTSVVDNLEKSGWVARQRDENDRRFVTVSLTSNGRTLISKVFPMFAASIARQFKSLTTAEQFTLGWLSRKLGTNSPNAMTG